MVAKRRTQSGGGGLTTALIYTRVSSEDQKREGLSLDAQVAECRRYAARQGWVLGGEFLDVMAGTRDDRPRYQALLEEVRRLRAEGQSVAVVVAALDRFGRKLLERVRCREELKALGVPTHSVREGGEVSDLVANILASVAQEEVRRLGERVRATDRHIRGLGWHRVGWAAWGYQWRDATPEERKQGAPKKVLEADPEAAPYVREFFQRVAGGEGIRAVQRWLATVPPRARNFRRMGGTNIAKAIRRPVYVARDDLGDADVLARPAMRWPALVDDETWHRAQQSVDSHQRQPHQATGAYLLTGFLYCPRPECGCRMCGRYYKHDRRYVCVGVAARGVEAPDLTCRYTASVRRLDRKVIDDIAAGVQAVMAADPLLLAELRRAWEALRKPPAGSPDVAAQIRRKEAELAQARERIQRATDLYVDGKLTDAQYRDKVAREQAAHDAAEAEAARLRGQPAQPVATLPPFDELLRRVQHWGETIRAFDVAAQRAMLAELIERVKPVKVAYAVYDAEIAWTPAGKALQAMREVVAARPPAAVAA